MEQQNFRWCHLSILGSRCPAVCSMNTSKHGINELPGWYGADRNLFQVRMSYTRRVGHPPASPVYQYYGSYSRCTGMSMRIKASVRLLVQWTPWYQWTSWVVCADSELHTHISISCQLGRSTGMPMEKLLPGCSYEECLQACHLWLPGVDCSSQKFVPYLCIVHTQSCTPSCLSSIYTSTIAATVDAQWGCSYPAGRTMNASKHGIFDFPEMNIAHRNCSMSVRCSHSELHTVMHISISMIC